MTVSIAGTVSTYSSSAAETSSSVSYPSGIVAGEKLYLVAGQTDDVGYASVSGFSLLNQVQGGGGGANYAWLAIWDKTADGTETGSVSVSSSDSGTAKRNLVLFRVSGHNGNDQIGADASGTDATQECPSVTTTQNDELVFRFSSHQGTLDSLATDVTSVALINSGGAGSNSLGVAYSVQAAAGSTGVSTFTTATSKNWAATTISVKPAASGGLTITSVTPSSFDSGIAGIVIAGSGFGASQGSSTVDIGGQAQTVTAWSDMSITITSARGSNSMGSAQLNVTIK